ncbi:MAG: efflux RND transporter periplasmic adaptor subunit, partial [Pseudomonadota bacterium]
TVERSFTGQIEAPQTVALAFEQGGTLKSVAFDEGQKVRAGQVIATLGDRLLQTERQRLLASKAALEAQRELIELDNERAAQLNKQGFASTRSLDQSRLGLVEIRARMAELDAAVAAIDVQLDKLTITAPFSGTVNTREFDPGSTIGGGQPVLTIIDDDLPVFRVGMVPALADTLPLNEVLSVDFGEQEVGAKVIAKLPQLDPITRTKAVRLQLTEPADIAFGATGKLTVEETIKSNGAWIPITAIEEGVRGLWTVKTVSDEDTPSVEVEAVELIHAETQRAFVRGTFPADTKIIVDGLHRTVVGQPVRLQ